MTEKERVIVTAYTGILMSGLTNFYKYAEEKLNRPVFTHDLIKEEVWNELKEASKEDFLALCNHEDD